MVDPVISIMSVDSIHLRCMNHRSDIDLLEKVYFGLVQARHWYNHTSSPMWLVHGLVMLVVREGNICIEIPSAWILLYFHIARILNIINFISSEMVQVQNHSNYVIISLHNHSNEDVPFRGSAYTSSQCLSIQFHDHSKHCKHYGFG